MSTVATWLGVVIAAVALAVAYITYNSQRARTRLEFMVLTNRLVTLAGTLPHLEVRWSGEVVIDPTVVAIRIVNTGDRAITPADFSSDLSVLLRGSTKVLSASLSKSRPRDLSPSYAVIEGQVIISPFLFNAGDMVEFQIVSEGQPSSVTVEGRIRDVSTISKRSIPYPPGSGPEGRMLGFDKFMWVVPAVVIYFTVLYGILLGSSLSLQQRAVAVLAASVVALVLYPALVFRLVKASRLWRG